MEINKVKADLKAMIYSKVHTSSNPVEVASPYIQGPAELLLITAILNSENESKQSNDMKYHLDEKESARLCKLITEIYTRTCAR
jgi:hypothetical protein